MEVTESIFKTMLRWLIFFAKPDEELWWLWLLTLPLTLAWVIRATAENKKGFSCFGSTIVIILQILATLANFRFSFEWLCNALLVIPIIWAFRTLVKNPNPVCIVIGVVFLAGFINGQWVTHLTDMESLVPGIIPGISGVIGAVVILHRIVQQEQAEEKTKKVQPPVRQSASPTTTPAVAQPQTGQPAGQLPAPATAAAQAAGTAIQAVPSAPRGPLDGLRTGNSDVHCPHCSSWNRPGASYCRECGRSLCLILTMDEARERERRAATQQETKKPPAEKEDMVKILLSL